MTKTQLRHIIKLDMHPLVGGEKSLQVRIHIEQVQFLWNHQSCIAYVRDSHCGVFIVFNGIMRQRSAAL